MVLVNVLTSLELEARMFAECLVLGPHFDENAIPFTLELHYIEIFEIGVVRERLLGNENDRGTPIIPFLLTGAISQNSASSGSVNSAHANGMPTRNAPVRGW